jgi:hypothetical protein
MKITVNKPAADVHFRGARFVGFTFLECKVFVAPHGEASAECLAVKPRQTGGFALDVDGGLEERIVKYLKPVANQPFYVLSPVSDKLKLDRVSERPARHIPLMRIWYGAADTEALGEDLPQITPAELWAIYTRVANFMKAPPAGRPTREMLDARELMEVFKRIARNVGEGNVDFRPLAEAMDLVAGFIM